MIKKGIQWLTDRMAQRFGHAARHLTARTGEQVNVTGLMLDMLTQRERQNELPWLTPQRAVELYEAWRRGELADVQRVWEQLEETDDTLGTVLEKRQRALADMPWAILTDAEAIGDDAERARKAELQQAYLQTVFNAVENLEEALVHLGMADFRGVAALEITGNMQRMRWEVIEPWCLARPVRRGPWMYNAKAEATFSTLEALDAERVIVREARPIDLACMFLIVDKMHAIHGWDAFLDVYGNPSIFLELPPATGEQMARVYDALAKRIIGDGRGTVPNGSKFQTVETRQNNCDSFEKRAKWCQDAIITVATGGLLTITTESGSGTLAGSAHTDSFENLVAGSAASISATINRQFTRRLLAAAFPDDPPLAYFSLAPEPADERMQLAQLLATLKTAGWQTTQEKASELMQMDVEPVPAAPSPAPMMNTAPEPAAPVVNRTEEPQVEEPPLTDEELAAFAEMRHPNPERMAQHLASVEAKLRGAADLPEDGGEVKNRSGNDECLVFESFFISDAIANCNQYAHDTGCVVSETANSLRQTEAGKTLQRVLDELKADSSHPSDLPVTLNPVNEKTAQKVSELCGRDISKHEHTASPSEIHHSRKKHTDMTDDDFMLMLDMQENWDALEYENRSNIPKIKYTKTYDGKEYTLVERIGRTPRTPDKQRQMQFSTEFKSDEK